MQLFNFTPGTIINARLEWHGWEFPDTRFLVLANYGDSRFLLRRIAKDSSISKDWEHKNLIPVEFKYATAEFEGGQIFNPSPVDTYKPADPDANSIEILAAAAEKSLGGAPYA